MSSYQEVHPGDLIFCLFDIPETPRTVGLAYDHGMITGAYTQFTCGEQMNNEFIEAFYIAMDDAKSLSYHYSGLRNTIKPPVFLSIKTPKPPLTEQDKIVAKIRKVNKKTHSALKCINEQITKLEEYKSALIYNAVTGKIKI